MLNIYWLNQRPRTRSRQRDRDRERIEEERVEPDTAGDDPEAAITFVGEVCARAATFGEDGVGDGRWQPAVKTGGGAV